MDVDDLPRPSNDPVTVLTRQDLEPFSIETLKERINALEGEIARCRAAIDGKTSTRSAADALFRS